MGPPAFIYVAMKEDQQRFLALLGKAPARLHAEQVAWVLNCQPHDVPVLVAARLLKPLGNPPVNGVKFFATSDVLELGDDRERLAKITNAITQHWRAKNYPPNRLPNLTQKLSSITGALVAS
jgi:hypothetical protein